MTMLEVIKSANELTGMNRGSRTVHPQAKRLEFAFSHLFLEQEFPLSVLHRLKFSDKFWIILSPLQKSLTIHPVAILLVLNPTQSIPIELTRFRIVGDSLERDQLIPLPNNPKNF